ncbi:MAG TPA: Rieske (2Fe-2S) protein [Nocardioidaceae bacterium]|nr:Rieske (2Fe-2S) protein [Nocardioidaceae bacterium]
MSRRIMLRGAAVTGVAAPLLAACATDEEPGGSAGGSETGSGADGSSGGGATLETSDVPLEGGIILADEMVVVTQPSKGAFKAFSAVCTHRGCPVQTVSEGTINCSCHGSKFSIEDGSVLEGPATSALEGMSVSVEGDSVRVS